MGLGGLRPSEKAPESAAEEGEASGATAAAAAAGKAVNRPGWGALAGRKKSVVPTDDEQVKLAEKEADDRNIRFTIGGEGKRMTKEDFLREVQQLDTKTRKEVVDKSTASVQVKRLAKQDPPPPIAEIIKAQDNSREPRSGSISPNRRPGESSREQAAKTKPSEYTGETAVERKRRIAVLSTQDDDETAETPAERRRREAALGMTAGDNANDDSDDEGDLPGRRGITFAEPVRGGKKR